MRRLKCSNFNSLMQLHSKMSHNSSDSDYFNKSCESLLLKTYWAIVWCGASHCNHSRGAFWVLWLQDIILLSTISLLLNHVTLVKTPKWHQVSFSQSSQSSWNIMVKVKVEEKDPWVERATRNSRMTPQSSMLYHMWGCDFSKEHVLDHAIQMRVNCIIYELKADNPDQPSTIPLLRRMQMST